MSLQFLTVSLDIYSISSKIIEKAAFYTIYLIIGSKQIEIYQKKSSTQQFKVNFHQQISLQISQHELQEAKSTLAIYAFHNYGRKKMFGRAFFQLKSNNYTQMKVRLQSCIDGTAHIEFRYRIVCDSNRVLPIQKISIINDRAKSRSQKIEQVRKNFYKGNEDIKKVNVNNFSLIQKQKILKAQQYNLNMTQEKRYVTKLSDQNLMSPYFNFYEKKKILNQNSTFENDQYQESMLEKKYTDCKIEELQSFQENNQEQRQFKIKNGVKANNLLFSDREKNKGKIKKNHSFKCSFQKTTSQILQPEELGLKIQSKILNISYYHSNQLPKQYKTTKTIDTNIINNQKESIKFCRQCEEKTMINNHIKKVKAKHKLQNKFVQRWENDERLTKAVGQVMNSVKDNFGYLKLSKLGNLNNILRETNSKNKQLIHANEELLSYENELLKELEQTRIKLKEKEDKLNQQTLLLKKQIEQLRRELKKKQSQFQGFDKKYSVVQLQMHYYQKQVKELNLKLQNKSKQIEHLKSLLIFQKQPTPIVIKQQKIVQQKKTPITTTKLFVRNSLPKSVKSIKTEVKDEDTSQIESSFHDYFLNFRRESSTKEPPKQQKHMLNTYRKNTPINQLQNVLKTSLLEQIYSKIKLEQDFIKI